MITLCTIIFFALLLKTPPGADIVSFWSAAWAIMAASVFAIEVIGQFLWHYLPPEKQAEMGLPMGKETFWFAIPLGVLEFTAAPAAIITVFWFLLFA